MRLKTGFSMLCALFAVSAATALISGCASPFVEFYTSNIGGRTIKDLCWIEKPSGKTKLLKVTKHKNGKDFDGEQLKDAIKMFEDGYTMIGSVLFNSREGQVDFDDAILQGEKIQAEAIIVDTWFGRKVEGSFQVENKPVVANTTVQGKVVKPSGKITTVSGTEETTVSGGSHTENYSFDRNNYAASYWAKLKPSVFGAWLRDLTSEERKFHQRNGGAVVLTTRKDSPAFQANILPDDLIIRFAGQDVTSAENLEPLINNEYAGKQVEIEILRGQSRLVIAVQLNLSCLTKF